MSVDFDFGVPPPAPENLEAWAEGLDVRLTWECGDPNATFEIWRKESENGEYSKLGHAGIGITTYTDYKTYPPSGGYREFWYKVKAGNRFGSSDFSDEAYVHVWANAPGPVAGLNSPLNVTDDFRPTFSWQPAERADSYYLAVSDDSNVYIINNPPNYGKTSYTFPADLPDLEYGKVYSWKVKARNNMGSGPYQGDFFTVVPQKNNLARKKFSRQSSTFQGRTAKFAADGNTDGDPASGSISCTNIQAQAWWEVDLGSIYPIRQVNVYNRTDANAQWLTDFKVKISQDGTKWNEYPYSGQAGRPSEIATPDIGSSSVPGRKIQVQLNGTNYLSLAEVEVIWDTQSSLIVCYPNGNYNVQAGSTTAVGWIAHNLAPTDEVTIDLYKNGVFNKNLGKALASAGSIPWVVAADQELGTDYKVRIHSGAIEDFSDNNFSIIAPKPKITVTAPDGGETWLLGTTQAITWEQTSISGNVAIELYKGTVKVQDIGSVPAAAGTFSWNLPFTVAHGSDYKIRIYQGSVQDYSNNPFSIALSGGLVNLALGKPASQSTIYNGKTANLAVDGNTDGNFSHGSVTCTQNEQYSWWQVDLQGNYPIRQVVIYNRTDCCMARLSNFNVRISLDKTNWKDFNYPGQAGAVTAINTEAMMGRYVRIQLKGTNYLSLAEVEVLGENINTSITVTAPNGGEKLVLGTTAEITWTSTNLSGNAAVELYKGTKKVRDIATVAVDAGKIIWNIPYDLVAGADYKIRMNQSIIEDYSDTPFSIALPEGCANLALKKPARQSSTIMNRGANLAVDGNTNGNHANGSVTFTDIEYQPWWQVDLLSTYYIYQVNVYNRTDAFPERLTDFNVRISLDEKNWQDFNYPGQAGSPTVINPFIFGRYVRIQLMGTNNLCLAEVEVMGKKISTGITVTAPNGGESWQAGSTQTITWSESGLSATDEVVIAVCKESWKEITVGTAFAKSGKFSWTIPLAIPYGSDYKVRIYWRMIEDSSDSSFSIVAPAPGITVTAPNGGENWVIGTTQAVTWTAADITGNVAIELYKWNTKVLDIGNAPADAETFSWHVPFGLAAESGYTIKISQEGFEDYSNNPFSLALPPDFVNLALNKPTTQSSTFDGKTANLAVDGNTDGNYSHNSVTCTNNEFQAWWQVDLQGNYPIYQVNVYNRTDCCSERLTNFKVRISLDGNNWQDFNYSGQAGTPSAIVTTGNQVPNVIGRYVRIQLADTNYLSLAEVQVWGENRNIGIRVTAPNGGESWQAGSIQNITWTAFGFSETDEVTIDLYKNGSLEKNLGKALAQTGTFTWNIAPEQAPGTDYKVRIYCGAIEDFSDSDFSITAPPKSITVTSPNGGEVLNVGSWYWIRWESGSGITSVKIECSIDNGSHWTLVAYSTPNNGAFQWVVPDTPSSQCLIRVSEFGGSLMDTSDGQFTIYKNSQDSGSLTLLSPNGGEVWLMGSVQQISWNSTGKIDYVTIRLSTDGGRTWEYPPIAQGISNTGTFDWTVGNLADADSTTCRISVSSEIPGYPLIEDMSDNDFSMLWGGTGSIPGKSPESGEIWQAGIIRFWLIHLENLIL